MKIEIKNQEIKFGKMLMGSLFAYPDYSCSESNVYMATEEYLDCTNNDKVNAVRLSDGSLHAFNENDIVRLLNSAKLIVE